MVNREGLYRLLGLNEARGEGLVTVYVELDGPRLDYALRFIFGHVLNVRHVITTDPLEPVVINYSVRMIPGALQIVPARLLAEKTVDEEKPQPVFKNGMLYLYERSGAPGTFHFDIFSAVFYMISRYEEWQAHPKDLHGRFEAAASILFRNGFHLQPVADNWIMELASALEIHQPGLVIPKRKFRSISTVDVDNLYAYRAKGLVRTIGASVKDLVTGDFKNLRERFAVLSGRKPDPFDIYNSVSEFCHGQEIPLIFFFLFRTQTKYDRTVDPRSEAFDAVFSTLKERGAEWGLHPSYDSAYKPGLLEKETAQLSERSGRPVTLSRQHYLRFDIRSTPGLLRRQGIFADFTMGFASAPGFRAGTSFPFYYYDFKQEAASDLLFVPFCAMDGAYSVYEKTSPEKALESMRNLAAEVRKVNGLFITVFHERTFSDHLYRGFGTLYKNLHSVVKE